MKAEHRWLTQYDEPEYWSTFSPIYFKSLPFIFGFYFNLGCGNGRFLAYADLGVDFSKEMLKRAKRTGKDVVLASILDLPFKDKSFDTAFMADTSIIIKPNERKKAYIEAKRVTDNFYDFLAEDRTFLPFVLSIFQSIPIPIRVTAYLALLFSFPIDRVRKLVVSRGDFATL
jgi:SAM-dependent methyltransferase